MYIFFFCSVIRRTDAVLKIMLTINIGSVASLSNNNSIANKNDHLVV